MISFVKGFTCKTLQTGVWLRGEGWGKFGRKMLEMANGRSWAWASHGCLTTGSKGVPCYLLLKNSHFVLFALEPRACKRRKTCSRLARCSSSFFPVMILSSRIQLVPDVPSHTWSMVRCQIAGAEVMPNTSQLYWNSPIWVDCEVKKIKISGNWLFYVTLSKVIKVSCTKNHLLNLLFTNLYAYTES